MQNIGPFRSTVCFLSKYMAHKVYLYLVIYMLHIHITYIYIYKWANALVPPTPIWRAMVIRCYAMLSHMFPNLS